MNIYKSVVVTIIPNLKTLVSLSKEWSGKQVISQLEKITDRVNYSIFLQIEIDHTVDTGALRDLEDSLSAIWREKLVADAAEIAVELRVLLARLETEVKYID